MSTGDFSRISATGVIHMHEHNQYWFLEETNKLALNTFIGLGYAKMVKRAIINADGTAKKDATGAFVFDPDETKPPVHYEVGYMIVFTDLRGVRTFIKLISIARGLTVLAKGTFSFNDATKTAAFVYDSDTRDTDKGLAFTPVGARARVD